MRVLSAIAMVLTVLVASCSTTPEPAAGWECGVAYEATGDLEVDIVGRWRAETGDTATAYEFREDGTVEINYMTGGVHSVTDWTWSVNDDHIDLVGADAESGLEMSFDGQQWMRLGAGRWERCS